MTVRSDDDFIVLPHWEFQPPAPCPDTLLSNISLTLSEPVLALAAVYESIGIFKSLLRLDQGSNSLFPAHETRALPAGSQRPVG